MSGSEGNTFHIPKSEDTQLRHKHRPIITLLITSKLLMGILTEIIYHRLTQGMLWNNRPPMVKQGPTQKIATQEEPNCPQHG